jgi:Domain of unknown function DUF29
MMADGDLYETDILAWSEQQASALRELASRRDLPNALDLAHVAEEIEDVGLSELNGVKSRIRLVLEHLLKCWAEPDAPSIGHWYREIANWQAELGDRFSPSMRQRIDLDSIWKQAVKQAALGTSIPNHPSPSVLDRIASAPCPLSLADILTDSANPAGLLARLEATLPR